MPPKQASPAAMSAKPAKGYKTPPIPVRHIKNHTGAIVQEYASDVYAAHWTKEAAKRPWIRGINDKLEKNMGYKIPLDDIAALKYYETGVLGKAFSARLCDNAHYYGVSPLAALSHGEMEIYHMVAQSKALIAESGFAPAIPAIRYGTYHQMSRVGASEPSGKRKAGPDNDKATQKKQKPMGEYLRHSSPNSSVAGPSTTSQNAPDSTQHNKTPRGSSALPASKAVRAEPNLPPPPVQLEKAVVSVQPSDVVDLTGNPRIFLTEEQLKSRFSNLEKKLSEIKDAIIDAIESNGTDGEDQLTKDVRKVRVKLKGLTKETWNPTDLDDEEEAEEEDVVSGGRVEEITAHYQGLVQRLKARNVAPPPWLMGYAGSESMEFGKGHVSEELVKQIKDEHWENSLVWFDGDIQVRWQYDLIHSRRWPPNVGRGRKVDLVVDRDIMKLIHGGIFLEEEEAGGLLIPTFYRYSQAWFDAIEHNIRFVEVDREAVQSLELGNGVLDRWMGSQWPKTWAQGQMPEEGVPSSEWWDNLQEQEDNTEIDWTPPAPEVESLAKPGDISDLCMALGMEKVDGRWRKVDGDSILTQCRRLAMKQSKLISKLLHQRVPLEQLRLYQKRSQLMTTEAAVLEEEYVNLSSTD